MDFTLTTHSLLKGERVFETMKSFIPDINIEDMSISFAAVTTDMLHEKEVVFTKGSFYEAARASVAIPAVFTPAKTNNSILVDGGVVNPIPLNRVKRIENDMLVPSYVNANIPYNKPVINNKKEEIENSLYKQKIKEFKKKLNEILPKNSKEKLNYFSLLLTKSTSLLTHGLSIMNIEKYKPDILINISHNFAGTFDFFKAEKLVETERLVARNSINNYKTKLL
ncbi:MAG: patatin-like phospholipase family protein [Bacteroidota bacterium]|nr:patatin-like phospholipase family protein [Bacteroidota bacterium]